MAVNITDTTVILSWLPPDPPNGVILHYLLEYRINGSSEDFTVVNISATNQIHTITELMISSQYRFMLTAFTVVGRGNSSIIFVLVGKLNIYILVIKSYVAIVV